MNKPELREYFLSLRRAIAPERRCEADAAICRNIRNLPCWREAEHVALYASDGEEPDLSALTKESGKRFYFPRYNAGKKEYELAWVTEPASELVRAKFGLLEPRPELPAAALGMFAEMLFLTPAVACDRTGVRLGRGGGFYDRLLSGKNRAAVAILYACQLTEILPREPHDRLVGFAVTEEEVLIF